MVAEGELLVPVFVEHVYAPVGRYHNGYCVLHLEVLYLAAVARLQRRPPSQLAFCQRRFG